jgi:hypothetical protein
LLARSCSMHHVYKSRLLVLIFSQTRPPGPRAPLPHLLANPCCIPSGRVLPLSSLAASSRWHGLFNVKRMGRVPTARKWFPVGKPGERYGTCSACGVWAAISKKKGTFSYAHARGFCVAAHTRMHTRAHTRIVTTYLSAHRSSRTRGPHGLFRI